MFLDINQLLKMTKSGTIAVITGDLVNSSQYDLVTMNALISRLNKEFDRLSGEFSEKIVRFSMYRGDSFQGIIEDASLALSIAIRLKALVNSYSTDKSSAGNRSPLADVRIAIGIGTGNYNPDAIHISNGEAFQLSGRALDTMKHDNLKMSLHTNNEDINDEFKVHMSFLDHVTNHWSMASAEVVYFLLKAYKERDIADELNRSQAAINLRKKAAGWEEIKLLLGRYDRKIKTLIK